MPGRTVPGGENQGPGHEKRQPKMVRKWQGDRATAADLVARGRARVRADGTIRLPNGKFVDYRIQGEDHLVTLLVEFTDPAHNQIVQPDRALDNSTYWIPDFSRAHYEDMMFSNGGASYGFPSMRDYYRQVSSGRYAVDGQVSEWVQVPFPESEFGANSRLGAGSDDANGPVFRVVDAAVQAAAADPAAGIDWSPSLVDVYDRYDCDEDGDFDEPDGYVDHLTIIHAGEGEEAGGGAQGGDAIWSHRWYANFGDIGTAGPRRCLLGGYEVPGTGLWAGDYTIEPENGGVGVLAHEFGHDLGLPDLYDLSGANDNAVSFWSIMSDGGWPSDDPNTLDTKPVHMGPWEKLWLGWLDGDLARVRLGEREKIVLGPAEGRTPGAAQAIRVNLPDYEQTSTIFAPEGSDPNYYYSGQGNDLDNYMTRPMALASATPITFRANYDIELDWDYAYLDASADGGYTFEPVETSLSSTTNPNGQNFGFGITGTSGGWVDGAATLPAGTTHIRFRYWTDGSVVGQGFAVDTIQVGTDPVDNATDPGAWDFAGFSQAANGEVTQTFFHYYLVESRSYVRNDESLCGAYQFLVGNFLEKQCYADGVLIWYRNSGYADNDVSVHPGFGQILVVDSHPAPNPAVFGRGSLRERWQTWDSTFGLSDHSVTLHAYRGNNLLERTYDAPAVPVFRDTGPEAYWNAEVPFNSVMTPGSGLVIKILDVSADGRTYLVRVA
jgi:immune inhibitor A